jgi:hypothetical protein
VNQNATKPADWPADPMAIALAFVYQMGRERERVEHDLAKKLVAQLAKAFDDGFVLGRETGLKDAQDHAPDHGSNPLLS